MNYSISQFKLLYILPVLCLSLPAQATKLVAQPLPHRADLVSNVQQISPPASRFYPTGEKQPDPQNSPTAQTDKRTEPNSEQLRKIAEQEKQKADKARLQQALMANNKAVQLGQAGKFEEAIASHEEAIKLAPENKQYRINLSAAYCAYGQKLFAKNNFAGAAHLFRQSLVVAPDNGLAGRLLIETLKKTGINPSSAEDRLALGDQLIAQGDLGGAGIEYQAAEQLEQSANTFVKMGDYIYRLGQPDLAASWYKQALVKDPDFGPACRQLGFIALAKQDQTEAAALLRKAVILDSKDTAASNALLDLWRKQVAGNPQIAENHLGLAGALQITGDLAAAEIEYNKVASIDPHHPALPAARTSLRKAYQHAEAQRHAEAADTLWTQNLKRDAFAEISQAVRIEPKNAQYQFFLGQCSESLNDFQTAHQAYLTCLLLDPENNKEAAARLKAMQQCTNNSQNQTQIESKTISVDNKISDQPMSQSIDQAVNMSNNGNNPQSQSTLDKVEALEVARNYDAAISILRTLVSDNLENSEIHHRLAVDLMRAGEIGEAISEFRIASALSPAKKAYADDLAQALAINKQALGTNQ